MTWSGVSPPYSLFYILPSHTWEGLVEGVGQAFAELLYPKCEHLPHTQWWVASHLRSIMEVGL